jgi:hypothetical protein
VQSEWLREKSRQTGVDYVTLVELNDLLARSARVDIERKLVVMAFANIHAGEVEGKESAQMLLRDFAAGRRQEWLDKMIFLVAPIFNADGNEKVSLENRRRQASVPLVPSFATVPVKLPVALLTLPFGLGTSCREVKVVAMLAVVAI